MNVSNVPIGLCGYFLFMKKETNVVKYVINVLFFVAASFFSEERLLLILLCELFFPLIKSKILNDIVRDAIGLII